MRRFAALIESLIYTRSRNAKLAAISTYLRETPDPDRGWALAALTDSLDFPAVKSATIRNLAGTRIDPELFRLSRHYVGDTAETVALVWPEAEGREQSDPTIDEVVQALSAANRATAPDIVASLLDSLDSNSRYALLKLAVGGMRVGVSARLAKTAFAQAFDVALDDVEELWHALDPPYEKLFEWAEQGGDRPDLSATPFFRPFMLSHPFEGDNLDLDQYAVEWKWDGIRVQAVHLGGETRLCRKTVSKKMRQEFPAFVRVYDLLMDGEDDLRLSPWHERRQRLESFVPKLHPDHFDLSAVVDVDDFAALEKMRAGARDAAIEGVMLKRRESPYLAGRVTGHWYKWKRDPLNADCVMMYAQRGNGRRASFYSDYTFGCWTEDGELLPVGKAYSGFTDEELKWLDRFVRQNTMGRFGPVREVKKSLVLEVAFDSIHESGRHKSGLAMRFPRIHRIRKDKPADEADRIITLQAMIS